MMFAVRQAENVVTLQERRLDRTVLRTYRTNVAYRRGRAERQAAADGPQHSTTSCSGRSKPTAGCSSRCSSSRIPTFPKKFRIIYGDPPVERIRRRS